MSEKSRILNNAIELFMKYGVKSVSMDDISRKLGISKKTLYSFIENKGDLIKEAIQAFLKKEEQDICDITKSSEDAIQEMMLIARFVSQYLRKMKPSLTYDLQKYYPETWAIVDREHQQNIQDTIKNNIDRGIKEGLYREDLNPIVISEIYVSISKLITDEDIFPLKDYSKADLYLLIIDYHLNAVVNSKGRNLLKKHLKVLAQ